MVLVVLHVLHSYSTKGNYSKDKAVKSEVRQGTVLSPKLFMKKLSRTVDWLLKYQDTVFILDLLH